MTTSAFSLQRQYFLDALRGFAILGIILVNIAVFSSVYYGSGIRDPLMQSPLDYLISFLISTLFETKFYLLFSFLFGYSFTIQMVSAAQKNDTFVYSFFRRLLGLLIIGTLHAIFLYHGDILATYALMGIILYCLRHQTDRFLITIASYLIVLTSLCWFLVALDSSNSTMDIPAWINFLQQKQTKFLGNWTAIIHQHWIEWQSTSLITIFMQAPTALAMFCLGLIAGRKQIFLNFQLYQKQAIILCIIGLFIGLPIAIFYGYTTTYLQNPQTELIAFSLSILTGPLLCIAYIVLAFRFYQTNIGQKLSQIFIPVGKTALSNYILQSLICTFIFFGIGFGLMGQLTPTQTIVIAFAIFLIQCLFSYLWLNHFKYGPLEWVLRCFTKWQ